MTDNYSVFSDKAPSLFSFDIKENELSAFHPQTNETFYYFLHPEQSAFSYETNKEKKVVQVFLDLGDQKAEITQNDILRSAAKAYHLWKHYSKKDHPFVFHELCATKKTPQISSEDP